MGPSESVALKLARTTKYELGSTYVLSETGFAGPSTDLHLLSDKTQGEASVGTVFIGLSGPKGDFSQSFKSGSSVRSENMTQFAKIGLQFLLKHLES